MFNKIYTFVNKTEKGNRSFENLAVPFVNGDCKMIGY